MEGRHTAEFQRMRRRLAALSRFMERRVRLGPPRISTIIRVIRMRRTSIQAIAGSVMTRGAMMRTIIWTIRGRMDTSPAGSGRAMFGISRVEDRGGSGSTTGIGA